MLSFFDSHCTPFLNLSPFAINHLYFFTSRIKHNWNWLPSVTLHAFSDLGLVASLKLRWLIGVEVSSANPHTPARQEGIRVEWIQSGPAVMWVGTKKTRSISQVTVEDTNKKKKLVDFAVVPGLKCIGSKMMLSIIGMFFYWIEDVDKWPMMQTLWAWGDDASQSPSTCSAPEKCVQK